jgi:cytochrome c-type biogenesis protein CcmH
VNRFRAVAFGLILLTFGTGPAFAVQPDEVLKDPALEARARDLSKELRCMVCQNQSIDDSDAPLARDLRLLVRERLSAGDSNGQVMDFLVARYGAFVLLRPPFNWHTVGLWLWSPLVLIVGGLALYALNRRRRAQPAADVAGPTKLTPAEQARLDQLLPPRG